jgi:WXXGXW repeat (2 copies)
MKRALIALALPVLLGLGCYAGPTQAQVAVAYSDPPPPPAYYYTPAPRDGYEWIDGNWYWNSGAWAWAPGYWVVGRPGYVYVQGSWGGHRWRPGYWQTGTTVVRDHRAPSAVALPSARVATPVAPNRVAAPPAVRKAPVVVRDHRR